jgi:hypothetical protein
MNIEKLLKFFGSKPRQISILTFVSILTLSKNLFGKMGESGLCFSEGALRFWKGENPYLTPILNDYFKYPPVFALLFTPLTNQAFLWGLLNIVVFWTGITLWFRLSDQKSGFYLFFFLICSMEMDGPIRHFQMNAFIIGATLIALYLYREEKFLSAGILLSIISSFKVFMLLIPVFLLLNRNKKYWYGCFLGALLAFFLPALRVGLDKDLWLHQEWIKVLIENANSVTGIDGHAEERMINLSHALAYLNFQLLGKILSILVLIGTSLLLGALSLQKKIDWLLWVPLSLTCILLINPGTEGPTFVIAVPSLLFLYSKFSSERTKVLLLCAAAFFLTIAYNDIWPHFIWNFGDSRAISKTFAVLLLWLLAAAATRRRLVTR